MAKKRELTGFEIVCAGLFAALILFALVEVNFNVANTFLGQNGAAAGPGWTVLEVICLFISAGVYWLGSNSPRGITTGWIIGTGFFLVLAICAAAGFNFAIA